MRKLNCAFKITLGILASLLFFSLNSCVSNKFSAGDYLSIIGDDYDVMFYMPAKKHGEFADKFLNQTLLFGGAQVKAVLSHTDSIYGNFKYVNNHNYSFNLIIAGNISNSVYTQLADSLIESNVYFIKISADAYLLTNYDIEIMKNRLKYCPKTNIKESNIISKYPDDVHFFVSDFQNLLERVPDNIVSVGVSEVVVRLHMNDANKYENQLYLQLKDYRTFKIASRLLLKIFPDSYQKIESSGIINITNIDNLIDYIFKVSRKLFG